MAANNVEHIAVPKFLIRSFPVFCAPGSSAGTSIAGRGLHCMCARSSASNTPLANECWPIWKAAQSLNEFGCQIRLHWSTSASKTGLRLAPPPHHLKGVSSTPKRAARWLPSVQYGLDEARRTGMGPHTDIARRWAGCELPLTPHDRSPSIRYPWGGDVVLIGWRSEATAASMRVLAAKEEVLCFVNWH